MSASAASHAARALLHRIKLVAREGALGVGELRRARV